MILAATTPFESRNKHNVRTPANVFYVHSCANVCVWKGTDTHTMFFCSTLQINLQINSPLRRLFYQKPCSTTSHSQRPLLVQEQSKLLTCVFSWSNMRRTGVEGGHSFSVRQTCVWNMWKKREHTKESRLLFGKSLATGNLSKEQSQEMSNTLLLLNWEDSVILYN